MIGIDIVSLARFAAILSGNYREKIISRILAREEIISMRSIQEAVENRFLAGRFAAKEAVIKASCGILSLDDMVTIKILLREDGSIYAYSKKAQQCSLFFNVSISHDGDYVVAVAMKTKSTCKNL